MKVIANVGVIGLGNMGIGMAKNLVRSGFETYGFDRNEDRLFALRSLGGRPVENVGQLAEKVDVVFVMVLNGKQAKDVTFGADCLADRLKPGSTVILTATIKPSEAREIGKALQDRNLRIIDSPVSGGFPGAQSGTLTMMAAGTPEVLDEHQSVMAAVGDKIFRVGEKAGDGQTVKAVLQGLVGSIFAATFEAAVLGAKSGIPGQVIYDVLNASVASNFLTMNSLEKIFARTFVGTGSSLATLYKDLMITMDHAREFGVPMFTTSAASQLFQAAFTKFPGEDNWAATKILEDIVGTTVNR